MATFAPRPSSKPSARKRVGRTSSPPPGNDTIIPQEEIAQRAFEKFMGRGCVDGFDQQDWFDAEDELKAEYRERL